MKSFKKYLNSKGYLDTGDYQSIVQNIMLANIEDNNPDKEVTLKSLIEKYIEEKYINSENYIPDEIPLERIDEEDFDNICAILDKYYEDKLFNISVLDDEEIMYSIFGGYLEKYNNKSNSFSYVNSVGYYDDNQVRIQLGVTLETPSGKEGKIREYAKIKKSEKNIMNGETNWIGSEDTLKEIQKKIYYYLSKDIDESSDYYNKFFEVNKNQKVVNKIITTGSGGIEMFKVSNENLENLEKIISNNSTYKERQFESLIDAIDRIEYDNIIKNESSKGEEVEKEMSLVEKLEIIQGTNFITSEDEKFLTVEIYETEENKYYREIENEKYQEDRQFESQNFKIRKTKETEKLIIAIKRIEKFNFGEDAYKLGFREHTATKDEIRSNSHSRNYIKEYIEYIENKNVEEENNYSNMNR